MHAASTHSVAIILANNIKELRNKRSLTQAMLAKDARIPRSTLALLETGNANPTLQVMLQLSRALSVSLEELLSKAPSGCSVYKKGKLPIEEKVRANRKTIISKCLPQKIPGMEIDRMWIERDARHPGVPHRNGTWEYLYCERGIITLIVSGERHLLNEGDVAVFPGHQPHSYLNEGTQPAIAFSVVALTYGLA